MSAIQCAYTFASMTTPQVPADAESAEDWEDGSDCRIVSWPETTIADVRLWLTAEQFRPTGDVVRGVMLYADCGPLSAVSARMVAAALLNAADELDNV